MKKVMVFGAFDFLHPGHFSLFKQAREKGDFLIVVVGRDANVESAKEKKPFFSERERLEMVEQVKGVDKAVLGDVGDRFSVIRELAPDALVLGYDQNVDERKLRAFLEENKLPVKVFRAKGFEEKKFKSSLLKRCLGLV